MENKLIAIVKKYRLALFITIVGTLFYIIGSVLSFFATRNIQITDNNGNVNRFGSSVAVTVIGVVIGIIILLVFFTFLYQAFRDFKVAVRTNADNTRMYSAKAPRVLGIVAVVLSLISIAFTIIGTVIIFSSSSITFSENSEFFYWFNFAFTLLFGISGVVGGVLELNISNGIQKINVEIKENLDKMIYQ